MSQVDTTAFLPIIAEDDSVQSDTLAATGLLRMENHTLTPHDFLEDSYFAGSPYFHPELGIAQNGEMGNPVPYTLAGDDIIIGLLLGCFMFIMVGLSVSRQTFFRQMRGFFYLSRRESEITPTAVEQNFQTLLLIPAALLAGLVVYVCQCHFFGMTYSIHPIALLLGIDILVLVVYFVLKYILYQMVNWVFFDKKNNEQWNATLCFLTETEGILMLPLLLLSIYGDMPLGFLLISILFVVFLAKLLTFYECFLIFFKRTRVYVQIFLYLCALELMPLFGLWGVLMTITNSLQIKY